MSIFVLMKVYPFKIPKPDNNVLIYQEDVAFIFYDKLHQHDEIQISFIEKGSGTLLVGDKISRYKENDVFVIGSNLPHVFKSDKNTDEKSKMLTLFFTKTSFGNTFFKLNIFSEIQNFFTKSSQGINVKNNKEPILYAFSKLKKATKLKQFQLLIEIIKIVANSKTEPLCSFIYKTTYSDLEGKRMRNIFDYTIENANTKISLEEISNIANMTKNAFCKYFKKRTNKTYINFLTELRIENACKLLLSEKDISINEIAFKTGFNNISNFNRKFKKIKKVTPTKYKAFLIITK